MTSSVNISLHIQCIPPIKKLQPPADSRSVTRSRSGFCRTTYTITGCSPEDRTGLLQLRRGLVRAENEGSSTSTSATTPSLPFAFFSRFFFCFRSSLLVLYPFQSGRLRPSRTHPNSAPAPTYSRTQTRMYGGGWAFKGESSWGVVANLCSPGLEGIGVMCPAHVGPNERKTLRQTQHIPRPKIITRLLSPCSSSPNPPLPLTRPQCTVQRYGSTLCSALPHTVRAHGGAEEVGKHGVHVRTVGGQVKR